VLLQVPEELAEIPETTGVPSKVIATDSEALKPEPVTVTEVPGGPLVRLMVMIGFTTVKVTPVTGPVEPVAPTVW
jgi:hypothetical protein